MLLRVGVGVVLAVAIVVVRVENDRLPQLPQNCFRLLLLLLLLLLWISIITFMSIMLQSWLRMARGCCSGGLRMMCLAALFLC
jgi:hypothetical protein